MSMKEGSQKVCVHLRGDDDKVDPKSRIPLRGRVQKIGAPFLKMSLTRGYSLHEAQPKDLLYGLR